MKPHAAAKLFPREAAPTDFPAFSCYSFPNTLIIEVKPILLPSSQWTAMKTSVQADGLT